MISKSLSGIQIFIFSLIFTGCAALSTQKPKEVIPRILVTPFQCSNDKIGLDITKGFVGELGKKIEVLDPDKFTDYLSTHSLKMEKLPDGSISISKFVPTPPKIQRKPPVSESSPAPAKVEEGARKHPVKELESLPGLSTAPFSNTFSTSAFGNPVGYSTSSWMSQAQMSLSSSPASSTAHPFNNAVAIDTTPSWAKPQPVSLVFKGTGTAISPVLARVINDLFKNDEFRTMFYQKTGVDYLAVGKAKEHLPTELELQDEGILISADTAQMKFLDLKTGELLLDESFKQGFFEIVAPDRIGSKFGSMVNDKIYQIRSERLKRAKEKLKQEQELRKQMGLDH